MICLSFFISQNTTKSKLNLLYQYSIRLATYGKDGKVFHLTLSDCLKEIESTMMQAVNEGRELSGEEVFHILKVQAEEIKRQIQEEDGLTDEELELENQANHHFKFGDK